METAPGAGILKNDRCTNINTYASFVLFYNAVASVRAENICPIGFICQILPLPHIRCVPLLALLFTVAFQRLYVCSTNIVYTCDSIADVTTAKKKFKCTRRSQLFFTSTIIPY